MFGCNWLPRNLGIRRHIWVWSIHYNDIQDNKTRKVPEGRRRQWHIVLQRVIPKHVENLIFSAVVVVDRKGKYEIHIIVIKIVDKYNGSFAIECLDLREEPIWVEHFIGVLVYQEDMIACVKLYYFEVYTITVEEIQLLKSYSPKMYVMPAIKF